MRNGIVLNYRGKAYRVHANAKCTRRTCSLFDRELCEFDCGDYEKLPCRPLDEVIRTSGLAQHYGVNYLEIKEGKK